MKLPRRMAWRVMIEKKISMFSHDPGVGGKCSVIRGCWPAMPGHPGACRWRSYRQRCAACGWVGLRDRPEELDELLVAVAG